MGEYYFLYALAFAFTLFATVQDLRKREVANWLNFSFITFALAYRAFYSISSKKYEFFVLGFFGFIVFYAFAHLLYYGRAFAGGDAKLLMAFGVILPYKNYFSLFSLSISFLLILFLIGAIYSLIYSIKIMLEDTSKFKRAFSKNLKKKRKLVYLSSAFFFISILLSFFNIVFLALTFLFLIPLAYTYTKALDQCMIKEYSPIKLTEGDWLEKSVKVKDKIIKKTVYGLSFEEIAMLKKYNKKVLIKEGIPFVPSFFFALIVLIVTYFLGKSLENLVFFNMPYF